MNQIINDNIAATAMLGSHNLVPALSQAQANLAKMSRAALTKQFGEGAPEVDMYATVPVPLFFSHPAFTQVEFTSSVSLDLLSSSASYLRVMYYAAKLFGEKLTVPTTDWVDDALKAIFADCHATIFKAKGIAGRLTNLLDTWRAVDDVVGLDNGDSTLSYVATALVSSKLRPGVTTTYVIYRDALRLYLVETFSTGRPGRANHHGFLFDGVSYYQGQIKQPDGSEQPVVLTNPVTGAQQEIEALTTGLTVASLQAPNLPQGTYAYAPNAVDLLDYQIGLHPFVPALVEDGDAELGERNGHTLEEVREQLLTKFVESHAGENRHGADYATLVGVLARQVPADLLADVRLEANGALVIETGQGDNVRFTYRHWRGDSLPSLSQTDEAPVEITEDVVMPDAETDKTPEDVIDAMRTEFREVYTRLSGPAATAEAFMRAHAAGDLAEMKRLKKVYGEFEHNGVSVFALFPETELSMDVSIADVEGRQVAAPTEEVAASGAAHVIGHYARLLREREQASEDGDTAEVARLQNQLDECRRAAPELPADEELLALLKQQG